MQEFDFDSSGSLSREAYYNWRAEIQEWLPEWEHVYSYNSDGLKTLTINSRYDNDINELIPEFKRECSYDVEGNTVLVSCYEWNKESELWVLNIKNSYQ